MTAKKIGMIYVIASVSGVGKTSLARALAGSLSDISLAICHTTRPPRPAEKYGIDYLFIDAAEFKIMLQQEMFLEHAEYLGHYYGTTSEQVLKQINNGCDVVLDAGWRGANIIKSKLPGRVVTIFLLPPSLEELERRIRKRSQDSTANITLRLMAARDELMHYRHCDYVVVNDDFAGALQQLCAIVMANRAKLAAQEVAQKELMQELQI